jgi:hypothetical protein
VKALWLMALVVLSACGSEPAARPPTQPVAPGPAEPPAKWPTPAGWKSETIPFPLGFAPLLLHRGVEELRFAPGMFDPQQPGYWSYTFVWRLEDPAKLDAPALARELTAYFRGLLAAVDSEQNRIVAIDEITVTAELEASGRFKLAAHVIDAFKTALPVDLVGWAERTPCGEGALWVFVFAPATSSIRGELDRIAAAARCGQP